MHTKTTKWMTTGLLTQPLTWLAAMTLLTAAQAQAQAQDTGAGDGGALMLQTVVEKVLEIQSAEGVSKTELVPVDVALPGDEVVYTVSFTNVGERPAENVLITNPIPPQMRYKAGSAFGPGTDVLYSADGGTSYAPADALRIVDGDGRERLASADDYTHIRWLLNTPIDPGAQGFARFRAVVR